MFTGLIAPMLGRGSRRTANMVIASHAGVGLAAFVLFLAWVLALRASVSKVSEDAER